MLFLYSSGPKMKVPFIPQDPKRVTMYVCGPTVYSSPHIGNARPAVVFDVLYRLLCHQYGYDHVVYASNFTDIDDKIIARAKSLGQTIDSITSETITSYREDMMFMHVLEPNIRPAATKYVGEMVDMIAKLISLGHAYEIDGNVYFSVASNSNPLLQRDRSNTENNRLVVGVELKHAPNDFVLWKAAKANEPSWESPWGLGRPGWHIECSAMIAAVLGKTIDIHGGGGDLMFPHHEAENAQSQCAHDGAKLANYWVHNGMITVNSEKMAKSSGGTHKVSELARIYPGEALRYAILKTHYRQTLQLNNFSAILEAKYMLDSFYRTWYHYRDIELLDVPVNAEFLKALHDDMNTPLALSVLERLAQTVRKDASNRQHALSELVVSGRLLGILNYTPDEWFHLGAVNPQEIEQLIEERKAYKAVSDWANCDAIRERLKTEYDVEIEDDNLQETFWRVRSGHVRKGYTTWNF